jgi:hypothetical protein
MAADQIEVLLIVVRALETLEIPYVVGGSFASSIHGMARATRDTDVVAVIKDDQARGFANELQGEFYADAQAIMRATAETRSFNVIHLESMFKVDVFVAKPDDFESSEIERGQPTVLRAGSPTVRVATPEDTILAKLRWYRLGNEVSDQQWRDVLNVLNVKAGRLNIDYLKYWAAKLNVADLLDRAMTDAGLTE